MLERQTNGSVHCFACGKLVSVNADTCFHCGVKHPGLWGYAYLFQRFRHGDFFINLVTWGCGGLYVLTLLVYSNQIAMNPPFDLFAPSTESLVLFGATGAYPTFVLGRWWTIFTAGWLHGNLLHIGFNLYWVRMLLPLVIDAYGAARTIVIYTISAVAGAVLTSCMFFLPLFVPFLPQQLQGAGLSVGASGALFGLFGALIIYGKKTGRTQFQDQITRYAAIGFLLGFFMGRVDNWGHAGGVLGGYLLCQTPWFKPRQPQKLYDLGLALACMVLTVLSLAVSILDGLVPLR
jgi:rhomboid protease GluP